MSRLPTAEDLPKRRAPRSQRPQLIQGNADEAELAGGYGNDDLRNDAAKIADAGKRIRLREEKIQRLNSLDAFRDAASKISNTFQAEGDLGDPHAVRGVLGEISAVERKIIESHKGGDDSKADLLGQTRAYKAQLSAGLTSKGFAAQSEKVNKGLSRVLGKRVLDTYENPGNFLPNLNSAHADIENSALNNAGKAKARDVALSELAESAIDKFLDSGAVMGVDGVMNDAMDILRHDRVSEAMGADKVQEVMDKIQLASKPQKPIVVGNNLVTAGGKILFTAPEDPDFDLVEIELSNGAKEQVLIDKNNKGKIVKRYGPGAVPTSTNVKVVEIVDEKTGRKKSVLIDLDNKGAVLKDYGTGPAPASDMQMIEVVMGDGEIHQVLVEKGGGGSVIKDFGVKPKTPRRPIEIGAPTDEDPYASKWVRPEDAIGQPGRRRQPVVPEAENLFVRKLDEKDAEVYGELRNRELNAPRVLAQVRQIQVAVNSGSFRFGSFGEVKQSLARLAEFFGATPEVRKMIGDAKTAEVADAAANALGLEMATELSKVTNMALVKIERSLPALFKTARGNAIIAEVLERKAKRDLEIGALLDNYRDLGTFHPGGGVVSFYESVQDLDEDNPIIDEAMEAKILAEASAAPSSFVGTLMGADKGMPHVTTQDEVNSLEPGTQFLWGPDRIPLTKDAVPGADSAPAATAPAANVGFKAKLAEAIRINAEGNARQLKDYLSKFSPEEADRILDALIEHTNPGVADQDEQ